MENLTTTFYDVVGNELHIGDKVVLANQSGLEHENLETIPHEGSILNVVEIVGDDIIFEYKGKRMTFESERTIKYFDKEFYFENRSGRGFASTVPYERLLLAFDMFDECMHSGKTLIEFMDSSEVREEFRSSRSTLIKRIN